MARAVLIAPIFWALLAEPALCGTGILGCCADEPAGAEHQSGCQDDACSQAVIVRSSVARRADMPVPALPVPHAEPLFVAPQWTTWDTPAAIELFDAPRFESDQPLRI